MLCIIHGAARDENGIYAILIDRFCSNIICRHLEGQPSAPCFGFNAVQSGQFPADKFLAVWRLSRQRYLVTVLGRGCGISIYHGRGISQREFVYCTLPHSPDGHILCGHVELRAVNFLTIDLPVVQFITHIFRYGFQLNKRIVDCRTCLIVVYIRLTAGNGDRIINIFINGLDYKISGRHFKRTFYDALIERTSPISFNPAIECLASFRFVRYQRDFLAIAHRCCFLSIDYCFTAAYRNGARHSNINCCCCHIICRHVKN